MAALRDASELLWPALAETLTQLNLGPEHAAASIGTVFGTEVGFNVAREFLPKVFHSH